MGNFKIREFRKAMNLYQDELAEILGLTQSNLSRYETNGVATAAYAVSNVPTFFLINKENEIVLRSDFMKGTLEDNLRKLL